MSSANETAEAILIVIKKIMKWIFFAAAALVVVFFSVIQVNVFWDWLTVERHAEKVQITLNVADSGDCSKDYPFIYIVQNKSEKTVEEVQFSIEVRKKGYSNKINSYTSITESKILKPNEKTASCFRVERDDYKGSITDRDVDFKLSYKSVKLEK